MFEMKVNLISAFTKAMENILSRLNSSKLMQAYFQPH